jgi:hypothetical protein
MKIICLTQDRMMLWFISNAGLELRTLLSIETPNSVNANGKYFMLLLCLYLN